MKKLFLKLLLLASPLLAVIFLTWIFLPVNFYYFRCWEALRPKILSDFFSGPYYPSMNVSMIEKGDLAPHTDLAVDKQVVWRTDKYGFRTTETEKQSDVVIIGDSNIVGTGMTQDDILSEVLSRNLRIEVYPYAPRSVENFLKEQRFAINKPKVVVVAEIERSLPGIKPLSDSELRVGRKPNLFDKIKLNSTIASVVTLIDRSFDPIAIKYLKRIITGKVNPPQYAYANKRMLFMQGEMANYEVNKAIVDQATTAIVTYQRVFKDLGIQMIFLPIPNKENIYYKMLPSQRKPTFLKDLINELVEQGVDVVDTQTLFANVYETKGTQLYHLDDTHWNAEGVRLTADELSRHLEKYVIRK